MADDEKTEFCSNCKRDIPAVNYVMHIAHCKRNIVLCKECQEPVAISQQDDHFEEYHAKIKCECGLQMERMQLEEHKENECPSRKVICSYCELELPFSEMNSHRDYCGSRTEMCEKCNRYIKFKDMDTHTSSDCKLPTASKPQPAPRGDVNHQVFPGFPPEMLSSLGIVGADKLGYEHLQALLTADWGRSPWFSDSPLATGSTDQWVEPNVQAVPVPRNNVVARGRGTFPNIKPIDNVSEKKIAKKTNQSSVYGNNVRSDGEDTLNQQIEDDHLFAAYLATSFGEKTDGSHDAGYTGIPTVAREREPFSENVGISSYLSGTFAEGYQALEETCLPCEFCGNLYPASELIQHESGCQVDLSVPPGHYPELRSPPRSLPPLNNELEPRQLRNNKRTELFADTEWNQGVGDTDEDPFLPCEFCNELLPSSALVQHQSNCDMGPQSRPSSVARASVPQTIINPLPLLNNSSQSRHRAKPRTQFESDESLIPESLDEEPSRRNLQDNQESKNKKQEAYKISSSDVDQNGSYQNRSTARGNARIIENDFTPRSAVREMKRTNAAGNQMPLSSNQQRNRRPLPAEERSRACVLPQESDETPPSLQSAFRNVRNNRPADSFAVSKNRGKSEEMKAAAGSRLPTQNEEPIPNGRTNQNSSDIIRRPLRPTHRTSDNREGSSVSWSPVFQDATSRNKKTAPVMRADPSSGTKPPVSSSPVFQDATSRNTKTTPVMRADPSSGTKHPVSWSPVFQDATSRNKKTAPVMRADPSSGTKPPVSWSPVFQDATSRNRKTAPITGTKQPRTTLERRGSGGGSTRSKQKPATGSVSQQRGGAKLPRETGRTQGGAGRAQGGATSAGTKSSTSRKKIV